MKWKGITALTMLLVFLLTLVGSMLFTLKTITFYNSIGTVTSVAVSTSAFPPYIELVYIIAAILVFTALTLFLMRHGLLKVIIAFFAVVAFLVLLEFFDIVTSPLFLFVNEWFAFLPFIAAILLIVYYFKYATKVGRNVINVVLFITIASIVSLALGVIPSMILLLVIAVYDYIAVFVTKHMITLANGLSEGTFWAGIILMARKLKQGAAMLGGGDLVFPAVLADALFLNYPPIVAIVSIIGALFGLSLILVFGKKGKAYPAMTFIAPMQIIFSIACLSAMTYI